MHFTISHNCFVNVQVFDLVSFDFFEKGGSKAVNMDLV